MTPPLAEILLELSHRGVAVIPEGDRLRLHPRSALTADLLVRIQAHRAEILALSAGVLPTREEWRVLAVLIHDAPLTHLLATTRLTRTALAQALCTLLNLHALRTDRSGHFLLVIN
jgi:hypothetical protein